MNPNEQVATTAKDLVDSSAEAGNTATIAESNRSQPHDTNKISTDDLDELAKQNVAPFLAKYQPRQYAPLRSEDGTPSIPRPVNAGYCYRHQPDSKCRRQADEQSMRQLQQVRRQNAFQCVFFVDFSGRNWRLYPKVISKASLMFGHFSLPLPPSSAN